MVVATEKYQLATLGGGCFWCLEAIYQRLRGVNKVTSGYSGGQQPNPTTADVYAGHTGHAEVIQLEFDPSQISYKELLEIFFVMHDPTTLNRQGNDVGSHYRSIILFHNKDQQATTEELKATYAKQLWDDPIVTEIVPYKQFWPAAKEHQDFYNNNSSNGYCQIIINPKLTKLRQKFSAKLL